MILQLNHSPDTKHFCVYPLSGSSSKALFFTMSFFGSAMHHVASRLPDQGLNLCPLHWTLGVLTTGPPQLLLHCFHYPPWVFYHLLLYLFQISFSYTILTPLRSIFCSYQSYLESASNHLTPFIKYCLLDTQEKYTVLTDILQPFSALMLQAPCVPKQLCTLDISMALLMCPLSPSTHVCLLKTHLSVRFYLQNHTEIAKAPASKNPVPQA